MNYPDQKIIEWADHRGLLGRDTTQEKRLAKLSEEFGELCAAILRNDTKKAIDGLGDMHVVMVQIAHIIGYPLEKCAIDAYSEIKNRTGQLVNGTFIKDSP